MKSSPSKNELKNFGLFVGFAFPLIIGLLIPSLRGHSFLFWTLYVGIPLIIIAVIKPKLLAKPYKFWIKLGNFLGWINSHIILTLVYLIVLIPISILMRLFKYDPLRLNRKNKISYKEFIDNRKIDLTKTF